jgi:hypothetical protein
LKAGDVFGQRREADGGASLIDVVRVFDRQRRPFSEPIANGRRRRF